VAKGRPNLPNCAAAPGNGKTTVLEGVCLALNTKVSSKWYAELRQCFKASNLPGLENACGVFVTFNNDSPVDPDEHGRLIDATARRLLAGYNYPNCCEWNRFGKLCYDSELKIDDVVHFLRDKAAQDGRTALVICVDEIGKFPIERQQEASQIMSKLCSFMSASARSTAHTHVPVYVVSSSLDTVFGLQHTTGCQRHIDWIFLGPLNSTYMIGKFEEILRVKLPSANAANVRRACQYLVSYSGGHPRSFTCILESLRAWSSENLESLSVKTLFHVAEPSATLVKNETPWVLAAAVIARLRMQYQDKLPGMSMTFEEMIKAGHVVNAIRPTIEGDVAKLSLMKLLGVLLNNARPPFMPTDRDTRASFPKTWFINSWPAFEEFHAAWECLVRNCLYFLLESSTKAVERSSVASTVPIPREADLAWLYAVDVSNVPQLAQSAVFVVQGYRNVRETSKNRNVEPTQRKVMRKADVLRLVLHLEWHNQPGFDSLVIEEDTEGRLWCIAIRNKFSQVQEGNIVPLTTVASKDVNNAVTLSKRELFDAEGCASGRACCF
jgi:hypothetical protein